MIYSTRSRSVRLKLHGEIYNRKLFAFEKHMICSTRSRRIRLEVHGEIYNRERYTAEVNMNA